MLFTSANGIRAAKSSAFMQSSSHHTLFWAHRIYDKRNGSSKLGTMCIQYMQASMNCKSCEYSLYECVCFWWVVTKVLKCSAVHVACVHIVHTQIHWHRLRHEHYISIRCGKLTYHHLMACIESSLPFVRHIHTMLRAGSSTLCTIACAWWIVKFLYTNADVWFMENGTHACEHPLFKCRTG